MVSLVDQGDRITEVVLDGGRVNILYVPLFVLFSTGFTPSYAPRRGG